jgi:hydrogenase-4 component F
MLLIFISITAMPPSGMFISEFLIFKSLFESHHIWLFIFILLLLTMIMWALGKNIFSMLFLPLEEPTGKFVKIHSWESLTQFGLLTTAIYLGLNPPDVFVKLIHDAILLLPK